MLPEATPSLPLLVRLREETRALHDSIEKSVDVFRPDFSEVHYIGLLQRFYGFYRPLEKLMERVPGIEQACRDYPGREKTSLLRRDLQFLGLSDAAVARLPLCEDLPALDTAPQALGCLYVTEGASPNSEQAQRKVREIAVAKGDQLYQQNGGKNIGLTVSFDKKHPIKKVTSVRL